MNIYIQELKMSVSSAIYWTIGMLSTMLLFMLMFPAISTDAVIMQQIVSKFPPEFTKALGLTTLDLSVVTGFYGFLFMYILLIGSVFAMKSGISVLSEEVRAKTADFLVAKPVTRTAIVTAKLMSVLTNILSQNIIYIIGAFIVANLVADQSFDQGIFLLINISLLFVQLFFVAFGLFLSVVIKKIKTVLPIALGTVFGFFVLQMLNQSLADAKLAYITPFAYYDVSQIIETSGYDLGYLAVNWILIIVFTSLTYFIFNKKDMPSV